MKVLQKENITRIEDHGTMLIAWLQEEGVEEFPVFFDLSQIPTLVNPCVGTLAEEELIFDGEVIWTTKDV